MKLNEIHFLPKANAFAEVYAKATGMPFIGEMMAAAAGNGEDGGGDTGRLYNAVCTYLGGGTADFRADCDPEIYEQGWEISLEIHCDVDGVDTVWFTCTAEKDPENVNKFVGYDNDDVDSTATDWCDGHPDIVGTFVSTSIVGEGLDIVETITGTWTFDTK